MKSRLVLDTSAYSRLRVGHGAVIDAVARADVVLIPITVLGELEAGFRCGSRYAENHASLRDFLAEPFVTTVSITEDIAHRYGVVFAELRASGTPIPVNDIWIAAATIEASGHLLTFDGDFARVRGLDATIVDLD